MKSHFKLYFYILYILLEICICTHTCHFALLTFIKIICVYNVRCMKEAR